MRRACGGLAWPAVAGVLLLCARAAAAVEPEAGICQTMDIRNTAQELEKLRGCRVIEGQLNIVLLEKNIPKDFVNLSFPLLREVTGYVKIYRLRGARNLGHLFPNLSVVRGQQLFKDYAMVIFDSQDMEMLGLRSLTTIERGAVRIQNNDRLCYANTIDWSRIIKDGDAANNIIRSNYDTRLCGLCPNAQSRRSEDHRQAKQCPADSTGRLLCWDDKHCQKVCPAECGDKACMEDGTCCHQECLGGCDGPGVHACHVCRHFSISDGKNRTCTQHCPAGTYQLYSRCVTEQACRQMPPPITLGSSPQANQPRIKTYKIFNNTQCVWTCPSGYMERGNEESSRCEPCPASGCLRECLGGKIDSIGSTEQFRGCTYINGDLDISIRATGSNTMAVLESALGEIRVINGGLRVSRSTPLVSLMFLKNLEKIHATGTNNNNKGISLYIFGNPNLELLWDWENHKPIDIQGRFHIHFNPKLCYQLILDMKNFTHTDFTDAEVSADSNGDQAPCYKQHLNLSVSHLAKKVAILQWDMYCSVDARKLLGYSIYYIVAEQNVTLYGQRDACSDTWNVLDITMDEFKKTNETKDTDVLSNKDIELLADPCKDLQPLFYPVTQLIPFTRYAAYVKTYTSLKENKGAQSDIIYFTTLPDRPSPPQGLVVESRDAHTVYIKWIPPAMPNGTITMYHVEIQANSYNRDTIAAGTTSYCTNPNKLATLIANRGEESVKKEEDKSIVEGRNGTCACRGGAGEAGGVWGAGAAAAAAAGGRRGVGGGGAAVGGVFSPTRFSSQVEEERWESILFENALQNEVYIKKDNPSKSKKSRIRTSKRVRRSIENTSLLSTLVILSSNTRPKLGSNYTNSSEGGYVKSLYYELDGKTQSLTVTNMRHFTWYTVNVWACREQHANETNEDYATSWCSERSYNTFRTMERPNADIVHNVRAVVVASNKTLPEVNVTWTPPVEPNGFVVAYTVHYARLDDSNSQTQDVSLHNCLTASECRNQSCGTVLRNLLPGNYSVRVTPISVSGAGNVSAQAFIFIEERAAGHEWIWGVICGCIILILILGLGIWYLKREFLQPAEANKLFASVNPEYVSTVYVPDEWEVPRANIEFIRELGQGSFGMVYEGIAKNIVKGKPETRCAVKTVNEHATDRERIEFLNEASVMKAFDTHHVVRLLGVVSRGQPTLVVMELMEGGDLKTYLRSHRPDSDSSLPNNTNTNTPPTLQNILQMAIEIADGMAYLSAKKFVHRDLAARNCMVAGDLTVKVGDFGMTRDIYETDYYRKGTKGLLPVRWMSPESLKDGVFSSNSDAWSYGVVLWEMATLAMQPYQGLSNDQVLRYVVEGGVMERPEHCPDRLYELMRACWQHRPAARPSFLQLVADLAPHAHHAFRQRSFFHSPHGQELYKLHETVAAEEEGEMAEVNVGAVATGSGSNLFGVSGRLASWVRELSSLRSRADDDAAAEPLQPAPLHPHPLPAAGKGPNGVVHAASDTTGC